MTRKIYKSASCEEIPAGFSLLLDGKQALTPLKKLLILPNMRLANAIVEEWQTQKETIRKETMPLTQIACVAIDLIGEKRDVVAGEMLAFTDTDLVCYRAGDTPELRVQQAECFDPLISWVQQKYGFALIATDGIMPAKQPADAKDKLKEALADYDDWQFAALAVVANPLHSIVLALAFIENRIDAREAYTLAHMEEDYETQQWGADDEKEARLHKINEEICAVERFLALL